MRPLVYLAAAILAAIPVQSQTTSPTALEIHRDALGMDHVVSDDAEAAGYGLGVAQMRDLPVTVARNYAKASGELASVFGAGPLDTRGVGLNVALDRQSRLFRYAEIAADQIRQMAPDVKLRIEAFVAGLNDQRLVWLASPGSLAFNTEPGFFDTATVTRLLSRPITLDDVVRHGVAVNGLIATSKMVALAHSDDPNASETSLLEASNSFALGPRATIEDVAMLVIDPHLPFQQIPELRTHFVHVIAGSENVGGVTFPGFPCVVMGFNGRLAWALSSNNPDVGDVWKAPTNPGATGFDRDGVAVSILREPITIACWDEALGAVITLSDEVAYAGSHDRPILREDAAAAGQPGTIWFGGSTFATDVSLFEFFIRLGQAASVKKARDVFDLDVILSNNFLMADDAGTLGYMHAGRVPLRGAPTPGTDWSQVQDGSTSLHDWTTVHPVSDLPYVEQRDRGNLDPATVKWVQCNATPDLVAPGSGISLGNYPDYMINAAATPPSWRQLRGRELLSSSTPITGARLREIAIDDLDLWWRAVAPFVQQVMTEFGLWQDPELAATVNRMAAWDLDTDPTLAEPLISHLVRCYYAKGLFAARATGTPLPSYADFSLPGDVPDLATFDSAAWSDNRALLATALQQADQTWRDCINDEMPFFLFPSSSWTPAPWDALSQDEAVWGTAHYVNITPYNAPAQAAAYPAAGNISLLANTCTFIANPWETIIPDAVVNGRSGVLVQYPVDAGAHTLMQIELRAGAPRVFFLEAMGASERSDDPGRYRHAAAFAAGQWQPFPVLEADIAASALAVEVLSYASTGGGRGNGRATSGRQSRAWWWQREQRRLDPAAAYVGDPGPPSPSSGEPAADALKSRLRRR